MKFMKLGNKPDSFQTGEDNIRYVTTDLATDIVVYVGDVKFYLHKFPLLSKSARLHKLVATTDDENTEEIHILDIPGGPAAFEICAKFCYGMTVTLDAYNVAAARSAAEYLEMYETVEKGNLVYKIEVFLSSSIFKSWKDSIIVLQTTKSFLPWSEELKIVSRSLESIASKVCTDTSRVEWAYTYNRKKLPLENGNDPNGTGVRKPHMVPRDWWIEDICGLQIDLYKRVITTVKAKGNVSGEVIGEALHAYVSRRLPGFGKGKIQACHTMKCKSLAESIIWLLPAEKGNVLCSFLFKLLRSAIQLECGDTERKELIKRIGKQLEDATVGDLLIRAPAGETTMYNVDIVQELIDEFAAQEQNIHIDPTVNELQDIRIPVAVLDTSKIMVAKLVDGYLAAIAQDPKLPLSKFVTLADKVSSFPRPSHDGLYRAIDMYLKEHPDISKSEKKRICKLMDCRKLSVDGCMHAVQNERLPLRVVVQVLFFEQVRAASSLSNSTPEISSSLRALLPGGPHGSSRSTMTNTEELDTIATADDIKALKAELATLRLGCGGSDRFSYDGARINAQKADAYKMKGLLNSKIFPRIWSSKEKSCDSSSSETSESPASTNAEETKSIPRCKRSSLS